MSIIPWIVFPLYLNSHDWSLLYCSYHFLMPELAFLEAVFVCDWEELLLFWCDKLPQSFCFLTDPHTSAAVPNCISFLSLSQNISTTARSSEFYCYMRNASSNFSTRLLQMPHGIKAIILNSWRATLLKMFYLPKINSLTKERN